MYCNSYRPPLQGWLFLSFFLPFLFSICFSSRLVRLPWLLLLIIFFKTENLLMLLTLFIKFPFLISLTLSLSLSLLRESKALYNPFSFSLHPGGQRNKKNRQIHRGMYSKNPSFCGNKAQKRTHRERNHGDDSKKWKENFIFE